jgi:hypothetical protein
MSKTIVSAISVFYLMALSLHAMKAGDLFDGVFISQDEECPICCEGYASNEVIGLFPCGHMTCKQCARELQKNECAMCNNGFTPKTRFFAKFKTIEQKDPAVLFRWRMTCGDEKSVLALFKKLRKLRREGVITKDDFFYVFKARNKKGRTFQHKAVRNGWRKLTLALKKAKIDMNVTDKDGLTPYDMASNEIKAILEPKKEPRAKSFIFRATLEFNAKSAAAYHWFPITERSPGGDPVNNLYVPLGPLDKLDKITGKQARKYEYDNFRNDMRQLWGHAEEAALAGCLLPPPKRKIVLSDLNGKAIEFDINDIQGLLVKVVDNLFGEEDKLRDMTPEAFLTTITEWAKDDLPFIVHIDAGSLAWPYSYDRVRVSPIASHEHSKRSRKNYRIEVSRTGYEGQGQTYDCYLKYDNNGQIIGSGWLGNYPRSLIRPHPKGDVTDKELWKGVSRMNPEIPLEMVYMIYKNSAF